MFDIGFLELLVIFVVGLLVIGPEKLPETARTIGLWIGRIKRSLRDTRTELEQQIGADDVRRQLHNEEVMRSINATKAEMERAMREQAYDVEQSVQPSPTEVQTAEAPIQADELDTTSDKTTSAADNPKPTDTDPQKPPQL